MAPTCEFYPMLPSPFSAGSLGVALLAGLTLSGYGSEQTAHVKQMEISGASHVIYLSRERLAVVPQQDLDDLGLFSRFALSISKQSVEVPNYFFDVLEEDFESLLA